jgi:glucose/arabinose dehydrogenase
MDAQHAASPRRPGPVLRRVLPLVAAAVVGASSVVGAPVLPVGTPQVARAAAAFVDTHFREVTVFSGLTRPTSVRFASDGRAFVTEKAGIVKEFDSVIDTTPTTVIDLSADTMNYWDRGLLSIAVDPDFMGARPYLYIFYVWGAEPGDTSQNWIDACPAPPAGPGGTTDGCVASTKVDRLTINRTTNTVTARTTLIWDACQQFPSHSGGGMAFGPDGQLYISFGDGASFNGVDYGQRGGTVPDFSNPFTSVNPCHDPVVKTSADGASPTVAIASAQGGQLRSQDVRTTGDPTGLDGAVVRLNPDTGAASSGNPLASSSDANTRRIIANGFRNPFRLTFRPGTTDLYVGHVGNQTWEAINRVPVPTTAKTPTTLYNAGWPCYEGPGVAASFKSLGTTMCADLYAAGSAAWKPPLYTYSHQDTLLPNGPCFAPGADGRDGGSPTGLAFYEGSTGGTADYPAKYKGGLFFVDYDRNCLAFLPKTSSGVPDGTNMQEIATSLSRPVDLTTGPGGDLYYVDHDGGRVIRIKYILTPVARATATPSEAKAPVTVHLDGTASTDPDPAASLVAWRWDLNDDGQYDDASGSTYDWAVTTPGVYPVSLQVESSNGLKDTFDLTVDASNTPPVPVIDTPSAALTWAVGDTINFTGHATDAEDTTVAASGLAWEVVLLHCPSDCHEHAVEDFVGKSGSIDAPDHEYPSKLELRLSATDLHGTTRTTSVTLTPRTKTVHVATTPTGVHVQVGEATLTSPSTTTLIEGGGVTISPPLTTTISSVRHRFWGWADSPTRVRSIVATNDVSLAATYYPDVSDTCTSAPSTATNQWVADRAGGGGDIDWYRFALTTRRRVVLTVGDLPVNARVDLYSSCSNRITGSDSTGTHYEELTRILSAGTYRVRVTFPGGGRSTTPYAIRFRPMPSGTTVKSSRTTSGAGGGSVRIVGEVLNNTGRTTGRATVTATFRNASHTVVGTLTTASFSPRLADGGVSPFVIAGSVPAYTSVSLAATTGSPGAARSLSLVTLTRTTNGDGTVTEKGSIRNAGTSTATSVGVARTWYSARGLVVDRGTATLSPSTLAPGQTGTFTIIRPVLPPVQAARTSLRAS